MVASGIFSFLSDSDISSVCLCGMAFVMYRLFILFIIWFVFFILVLNYSIHLHTVSYYVQFKLFFRHQNHIVRLCMFVNLIESYSFW